MAELETYRDELSKEEIREELLKELSDEELSIYEKKISIRETN